MRSRSGGLTRTLCISSDSTSGNGVATPFTGWMASGDWDSVRARWRCIASLDVEIRLFVQYSNDGISIDATHALTSFGAATSWTGLDATALPDGVTERLLVRFGFEIRRTNGGSVPLVVPMVWQVMPAGKRASQQVLPPTTLASPRSTTASFQPVTEALPVGPITSVRGTLELIAGTVGEVCLGYQTSTDGVTWSAAAVLPGCSYASSTGMHYAAWTSISPGTAQLVRFGYLFRDTGSPTRVNVARASGRVEVR